MTTTAQRGNLFMSLVIMLVELELYESLLLSMLSNFRKIH